MDGHIFISYATKDREVAEEVCESLEVSGWRCWIAPRDVLPSSDWGEAIIDAISQSRLMVLVFSGNANNSMQIKREVERATSKGIPVVPIRLEDVPESKFLEYHLSTSYWVDAVSRPLEPHLQYLNEVITKVVGAPVRSGLCGACGAAVEPGAESCGACGHKLQGLSAAQGMPQRVGWRRRLRRLWQFRRWSRATKVGAAVAFAAVVTLGVYVGTRHDGVEAYVSRAEAYMRNGEYDLGIEEFSKGVRAYSNDPLGYRSRGYAYFFRASARNLPDDFQRAAADFTTATQLAPRDSYSHSMLGQTYLRMGEFHRAAESFAAALSIDSRSADALRGQGHACFGLKDYDCAIQAYTSVLDLYPRDTESLLSRGYAYVESRKYADAISDFKSAMTINTSNPAPYRGMSEVYRRLDKPEDALKFDREANKLYSTQAQPTPAR